MKSPKEKCGVQESSSKAWKLYPKHHADISPEKSSKSNSVSDVDEFQSPLMFERDVSVSTEINMKNWKKKVSSIST